MDSRREHKIRVINRDLKIGDLVKIDVDYVAEDSNSVLEITPAERVDNNFVRASSQDNFRVKLGTLGICVGILVDDIGTFGGKRKFSVSSHITHVILFPCGRYGAVDDSWVQIP